MAGTFLTRALGSVFDLVPVSNPLGGGPVSGTAGILPGQSRGAAPRRGTREFLEAYSNMPWLRAASERVANSCAAVTWRLYTGVEMREQGRAAPKYYRPGVDIPRRYRTIQRAGHAARRKALYELADSGKLREIEEHPMLDLLQGTAGYLVGQAVRKLLFLHYDLTGTAFWYLLQNDARVPDAALPVPPHWISELPTADRRTYRTVWRGEIPEQNMLMFVDPDPANPYTFGSGVARALGDELDADELAAKHIRAFFYNSARPDLVISGEAINESNTAELQRQWMEQLRGYWNRGKPFFASDKINIEEIGQTFKEMDLIPLRQHERDTITQVYGLPPEIMGIIENSNRATIDAADYLMSRYVVVPRLEFIRETLQERLAPLYDENLIVDYDNPVAEDGAFHLQVMQAKPAIATVNEWRELAGLEPLPGPQGRLFLTDAMQAAVKKLTDLLVDDSAPAPSPGTPAAPPAGDPDPGEGVENPAPSDAEGGNV